MHLLDPECLRVGGYEQVSEPTDKCRTNTALYTNIT